MLFEPNGCPPITGGNVYRYVSEGNFKQNQLILNTNVRVGAKVQLFGFYTLGYANGDASGVSSFPTNSYDIARTTAARRSTSATGSFSAAASRSPI